MVQMVVPAVPVTLAVPFGMVAAAVAVAVVFLLTQVAKVATAAAAQAVGFWLNGEVIELYKYAQILNGEVHWIFEDSMTLEELGQHKFNLGQIQLVDITNNADVREGWEYDGVNFTDPNVLTLDEARTKHINAAGAEFARRRDAIRWVDGYGFDCQSEDITNFMAAFTPLLVAGSGSVYYKVWLTETTKGVIERDYEQMLAVYNEVRTSQLEAYSWYEGIKGQLNAAETIAELEQIYQIKESE